MTLNLHIPDHTHLLKPTITVVGVGGAGGNAVNNMIAAQLEGVSFVVANTDAQALDHALTERTIQLGAGITKGLGAGANPGIGKAAAEEAMEDIAAAIDGSNMVFITAGMGGGTGTGAAPVVAKAARDQDILTVAVVTKPFQFEGSHRMKLAEEGLKELQEYVDTLIIIPNQNLFRIANERTTFADAFKLADEVLHSGVRGVTDLMVKPGLINLDFADIRTVMSEMGKAMMGTGEATGERRATEAAEAAISNPLLDDVSLKGAKALLINITGGNDMTLFEVDEAANRIREEVDSDANIIFGSAFNDNMEGTMRVSVVATGIDAEQGRNNKSRTQASNTSSTNNGTSEKRAFPVKQETVSVARPGFSAPKMEPVFGSASTHAVKQETSNLRSYAQEKHEVEKNTHHAAGRTHTEESSSQAARQPAEHPTDQAREQKESYSAMHKPLQPSIEMPEARNTEMRRNSALALSEETTSPVKGLFQRIADVSKALASRHEEEDEDIRVVERHEKQAHVHASESTGSSVAVKKPKAAEEEYLDIPAFLRRQAN